MSDIYVKTEDIKSIMNNINNILINNNSIIYDSKEKEIIQKLELNNRELKLIQEKLMNITLIELSNVLIYDNVKINLSNNIKIETIYKEKIYNIVLEIIKKNNLKDLFINITKENNHLILSIDNLNENLIDSFDLIYKFENNKLNIYLEQSVSVVDTLEICVGDLIYLLPIEHMIESLQPNIEIIKTTGLNKELLILRESLIPIIRLSQIFNIKQNYIEDLTKGILIVVKYEKERFCIFVDKFLQQTQSVVKPLDNDLININGILGTSIRGNNEVCLVLDIEKIYKIGLKG